MKPISCNLAAGLVILALLAARAEAQVDLKAFQKAAVAYGLEKQQKSAYKLGPNESMNYRDLYKKLSGPIEQRRREFRDYLDKNPQLDSTKLYQEFTDQEDAGLYNLFRENLAAGHHCEAHIYYGWIVGKDLQNKAAREVYQVYIRSYETALAEYRAFEKEQVKLSWSCKSLDGKTTQKLRLVSEGVRPQSEGTAKNLYADKDTSTTWPSFPTVVLTFKLSDGTDAYYQNFMQREIRHYDRTPGDRLKEGLDWLTGRWGGPYEDLLRTKGLAAAVDAFAANLEVDATTYSISFKDRATKVAFELVRTTDGTVYIIRRSNFLLRCSPVDEPREPQRIVGDVALSGTAQHAQATVRPGGTLKVRITVAGGTGYKLHLAPMPANTAALVGAPVVEGPTSKKLGAPSIHQYEFRIAAAPPPGFRIVFRLLRPGQTTGPEYDVVVTVLKKTKE